jgi:hypothetical protein
MNVLSRTLIVFTLFSLPLAGQAGTEDESKVVEQPPVKTTEPWEIRVSGPGWLAGLNGDTGIHGITTHVDFGFTDILRRLDFIASLRGEIRKGRWGVLGEFLYLARVRRCLYQRTGVKLDLRVEQFLGDFGVNYRIIQGPHGWLDLLAGFRYINLRQELTVHPNDQAIDTASTQTVNQVAQSLGSLLQTIIQRTIVDKLSALDDRNPVLPEGPLAGRRPGIIRDLIQNEIQNRLADLLAAIRTGAQARVNQLKTQLSNQIATTLKSQLDTSFARTDDWFDPYIGLRARYNLSKAFYLTGKADVGGFGVGSDVTTQVSGALGCQITRNIFSEVGYRYLYIDYQQNDFLYRVSMQGAELTLGINF